jgi:hypothetical protein
MIRVVSAKILNGYLVKLKLSNGSAKTVDLEPFLRGLIFEPIKKSYELFRTLKVDKTLGTIVWENGADIDPDVLLGKKVHEQSYKLNNKRYSETSTHAFAVKELKPSYTKRRK